MGNKFYITTAIAYTSKKPHIGNTYEAVLTDAIARYKRLRGFDVFFLTGTDEHGQKIQQEAEAAGITPQEYVDNVAGQIKAIWDLFNVSYDKFIRTTDEEHVKCVQKFFTKLYEQGDIYKGSYEGNYCTPCESFWTDTQLVDGKCPDCGRECKKASEEAYFLKMSKYADRLIEYYNSNEDFIKLAKTYLEQDNCCSFRISNLVYYQRTDKTDIVKLYIQIIKIGEFALYVYPGEMFSIYSHRTKEFSPFKYTMVVENSNSYGGYIAPPEAYEENSFLYEIAPAYDSFVVKNGGEMLYHKIIELSDAIK